MAGFATEAVYPEPVDPRAVPGEIPYERYDALEAQQVRAIH